MSTQEEHEEQKKVMNLYAIFGVTIILSVLPYMMAAALSAVFFTVLLIAAYMLRNSAEDGSLGQNHGTFLIRTIWIGSLYATVLMGASTFYMLSNINYGPLEACASAGSMDLYNMIGPCLDDFIATNYNTFLIAAIITGGPVLLFFAVRFTRGFLRAKGGYRLANPGSWL